MSAPPALSQVHNQYVEAMVLYRQASNDMLAYAKDGERQHLIDAHDMSITASQAILRAGEVLWPGSTNHTDRSTACWRTNFADLI